MSAMFGSGDAGDGGSGASARESEETENNSFAECEVDIETDEEGVVNLGSNATVSPLWRYFELVKEGVPKGQKPPAKCTVKNAEGKLCGHVCKRTKGNTSSMKSHLKSAHPGPYAEFVKATSNSASFSSEK